MTAITKENVNYITSPVGSPPPLNLHVTVSGHFSNSAHKIRVFAHPVIKVLGLILLQGITCALDAYCLVSPIIVVEMTRLIFLCALAVIVQNHSISKSLYTDSIVSSFVQA
jgi:hypothetical protein